jgi:TIR domain-containing protein
VALSFAGAQRAYVGQVAAALKVRGVRCFYDDDEQVRLWGTHLAEELPRIYARESAAVVVFVAAEYAGQDWTRLERRAAFSRAVAEAGVYVLPARFDDSELPGLLVSQASLRRLGVHAAITVPGVLDDVLPEYVPRDVDAAEFGVRARVAAAAQAGGFVLLVGGSSVGKTRCAAEAAAPTTGGRRRRVCRRSPGRAAGRARRPGRGHTDTPRPGQRR